MTLGTKTSIRTNRNRSGFPDSDTDVHVEAVAIVGSDGSQTGTTSSPVEVNNNQSLVDSKGRLRHSNFMGTGNDVPLTIFDTKQIFDSNPLFWDDQQVSGTATSVHSVNEASSTLGVSLNTAGVRTRQSFMWHNYQPAKVQHIIQTGVLILTGGGTGITVYVIQGEDNNGLGFFYDEGVVKTLVRTKTSGSVVNNTESQANWDDPMDGTGRSGKTIDWTKEQIFGVSYGWLGVDAVVFWLKVDGEVYVVNIVENSNNMDVPYISSPNLPLRWRIENDGTGAASTTKHTCGTVITEGGTENFGNLQHASTSGTHVDLATENVIYPIIGIRLKAARLGASVLVETVTVATNTASGHFDWFLVFNPSVTGTFTYTDRASSSVQVAVASGAGPTATVSEQDIITGGIVIAGSGSAKGGGGDKGIANARRIGSSIAGTPDTVVLCVKPIMGASGIDIEASVDYREIN
jgi:hypothetical protein